MEAALFPQRCRHNEVNADKRRVMLKSGIFAALLVTTALSVSLSAQARPIVPESQPAASNILPVQGYWERCRYLRERIREAEGRLYYAQPWERSRIERRLFERREEFRATCRRGGYY
jgi:hypothetical protein